MAPAHLPDLKPQQPEAQSASLVQGPVINCFPAPFPAPFPVLLLAVDACAATAVEFPVLLLAVDACVATAVEFPMTFPVLLLAVDACVATGVEELAGA
jgi:hypothetical protein